MDKAEILEKNIEQRIVVSKLLDKIEMAEKYGRLQNTNFLSPVELETLENVLKRIKFKRYELYGAKEDALRKLIIIYPEKLSKLFQEHKFNYNSICTCIRISGVIEKYEHKVYLGACIKLGVSRDKIGDIVVYDGGADIIVCKEVGEFLLLNLGSLTRFKQCNIKKIDVSEILYKKQEYEDVKIIVSSVRLDSIVSEIAKTSRAKACTLLETERVLVNYKCETKATKQLKTGDIVTVRGFGKFIVNSFIGNTRNGRIVILLKKFI